MKITLQACAPGCFLVVCEDGGDLLIQTDWDFPGLAGSFGWVACPCGETDGTVDCGHRTRDEMMAEAFSFLLSMIGMTVDDPGYFSD